jgi:putative Ca2+/H+ antiporter (TMEM165/GDT1 family)
VAFGLIFLAELGDKTQLATLMLSANGRRPVPVFLGAALALVVVTLISSLLGDVVGRTLPVRMIHTAAGLGFLVLGGLLISGRL